jgi:hypothetical protein
MTYQQSPLQIVDFLGVVDVDSRQADTGMEDPTKVSTIPPMN